MGLFIQLLITVMGMFTLRGERELNDMFTFTAANVDAAFGRPTPLLTACYEHTGQARGVIRQAFANTEVYIHPATSGASECQICRAISKGLHTEDAAEKLRQHFMDRFTATQSATAAQAKVEEERVLSPEVKQQAQAVLTPQEGRVMHNYRELHQPGLPTQVWSQRKDGKWNKPYTKPAGYADGSLLTAAAGLKYEARAYRTDMDNIRACFDEVKSVGTPTMLQPTSSGFAAIWIYDEDGNVRPWMDPFGEDGLFSLNMKAKVFKRISLFMSDAWLWNYFADEQDVNIKVIKTAPGNRGHDGNVYISHSFRERLISKMIERADDKKEAAERAMELREHDVYNIRVVTPFGLIKGDAVVGKTDGYDIIVHAPDNLKDELSIKKGVYAQLIPHVQYESVRTDRQALSFAGEWLFMVPTPGRVNSLGLIKDALIDHIDTLISKLRRGIPIDFDRGTAEEDELESMKRRRDAFYKATGSLNESIYHLQMMADSVVRSLTPYKEENSDKKRRFPVPFASRVCLRTEAAYEFAYKDNLGSWGHKDDVRSKLAGNNIAFTPIGFVISDEVRDTVLDALGGADLDDAAAVHIRIAGDNDEFFGIKKGDIVAVIIRPPSASTNGAHEYWVSNISTEHYTSRKVFMKMLKRFGINNLAEAGRKLPVVRLGEHRPTNIMEIELPESTMDWQEPELPDTYTKLFVANHVLMVTKYAHVYGAHASISMACAEADFPTPWHDAEEEWVDAAMQKPYEPNMEMMDLANDADRDLIIAAAPTMEPWYAKRAGLYQFGNYLVPVEEGLMSELIEFHREQVDRYAEAAREHIANVAEVHTKRAADHEVNLFTVRAGSTELKQWGQQPYLMAELLGAVKLRSRDMDIKDVVSDESIMDKVTDSVYDRMMNKAADKADELIMESFFHSHLALKKQTIDGSTDVRVFAAGDHHLMFGQLFVHLLGLLRERGSVQEDWAEWVKFTYKA